LSEPLIIFIKNTVLFCFFKKTGIFAGLSTNLKLIRMKKLLLLIVLFVYVGVSTLLAQTRVITGTVTSATQGEGAIPGVTVQVKGTTIGALTDLNGKYSVTAPTTATTLVFSYVGMKTVEVPIAGQAVIDVVMESSLIGLQEVVVTSGYGIRREPKGSVTLNQVVSGDKLTEIRQVNVNNALAGKISGIQFRGQSAAALGRTGEIRLRGSGEQAYYMLWMVLFFQTPMTLTWTTLRTSAFFQDPLHLQFLVLREQMVHSLSLPKRLKCMVADQWALKLIPELWHLQYMSYRITRTIMPEVMYMICINIPTEQG
jgi:hypothetical protein